MTAMDGELAPDPFEIIDYRDDPPVHLFADSRAAIERMRRTAAKAGCRTASAALIQDDPRAYRACLPGRPALIALDGAASADEAIPLLDWAQAEAVARRRWSVVVASPAMIDLVAARAPHPDIAHLCEPAEEESCAALVSASQRGRQRLNDISRDDGSLILQQLSEDVGRIAAILASLSEEEAAVTAVHKNGAAESDDPGVDAPFIRAMIRARRLRDQFFRSELFADPAWDMLLDLMAARLEKNQVAVSSLCIAAAVPATTALRWIKALTDRGLFVRAADPQDGRRVYIELSDDTARALGAYLRAVQRVSPAAV